jgi:hypothetical protein
LVLFQVTDFCRLLLHFIEQHRRKLAIADAIDTASVIPQRKDEF